MKRRIAAAALTLTAATALLAGCGDDDTSNTTNIPDEYHAPLAKAEKTCEFLQEGNAGHHLVAAEIRANTNFEDTTTPAGAEGPTKLMPIQTEIKGVDGNGDGKVDPHNVEDATATLASINCEDQSRMQKLVDSGDLDGDILDFTIASYYTGGLIIAEEDGKVTQNPAVQKYITQVRDTMNHYSD